MGRLSDTTHGVSMQHQQMICWTWRAAGDHGSAWSEQPDADRCRSWKMSCDKNTNWRRSRMLSGTGTDHLRFKHTSRFYLLFFVGPHGNANIQRGHARTHTTSGRRRELLLGSARGFRSTERLVTGSRLRTRNRFPRPHCLHQRGTKQQPPPTKKNINFRGRKYALLAGVVSKKVTPSSGILTKNEHAFFPLTSWWHQWEIHVFLSKRKVIVAILGRDLNKYYMFITGLVL